MNELSDVAMGRIGFGKRFIAAIVDGVLIVIGGTIVGGVLGGAAGGAVGGGLGSALGRGGVGSALGAGLGALAGASLGISIFGVLYGLIEAFTAASPGKRMTGIRIAKADKTPAGLDALFLRYAIKNVAFVFSSLALVSALDMLGSIGNALGAVVFFGFFLVTLPPKQALHDMLAKTAVYDR